jgi:diguanylate cyclase (GGDEF)-like protein
MDSGDGIAFLTERVAAIERERDDLLVKSQRLEMLQRSFVDTVAARDEASLAAAALRGAWLGLGFARALWFRIDGAQEVSALYELDGESVVESEYGGTLPEDASLYRITCGDSDVATGWADDADAPLFDTRRRYAAAAVRVKTGPSYLLYVDGSSERVGSAWSVASLQELATQAAFALERMRLADELERLAMRDPLTGLFNRRALMERAASELATMRRTGEPLAFAMIDVDDFKRINDTRGHAGGDAALTAIAHILESQTRETDTPARFAGDEFSILMPRSNRAAIAAVTERIYRELASSGLSASIGVAFADGTTDVERLIARADAAVYEAKAAGKNCYRVAETPA